MNSISKLLLLFFVSGLFAFSCETKGDNLKLRSSKAANIDKDRFRFNGLCDLPQRFQSHAQHHPYPTYFDYDEGIKCAQQLGERPVLIMFDAFGAVWTKQMKEEVFAAEKVSSFIRENFIVIWLYVDDRTELPKNLQSESVLMEGAVNTRYGNKNVDLQYVKTQTGTQPYLSILNLDGDPIALPFGYSENAQEFYQWLKSGKEKFALQFEEK